LTKSDRQIAKAVKPDAASPGAVSEGPEKFLMSLDCSKRGDYVRSAGSQRGGQAWLQDAASRRRCYEGREEIPHATTPNRSEHMTVEYLYIVKLEIALSLISTIN